MTDGDTYKCELNEVAVIFFNRNVVSAFHELDTVLCGCIFLVLLIICIFEQGTLLNLNLVIMFVEGTVVKSYKTN